jgi:hypothetical protein
MEVVHREERGVLPKMSGRGVRVGLGGTGSRTFGAGRCRPGLDRRSRSVPFVGLRRSLKRLRPPVRPGRHAAARPGSDRSTVGGRLCDVRRTVRRPRPRHHIFPRNNGDAPIRGTPVPDERARVALAANARLATSLHARRGRLSWDESKRDGRGCPSLLSCRSQSMRPLSSLFCVRPQKSPGSHRESGAVVRTIRSECLTRRTRRRRRCFRLGVARVHPPRRRCRRR